MLASLRNRELLKTRITKPERYRQIKKNLLQCRFIKINLGDFQFFLFLLLNLFSVIVLNTPDAVAELLDSLPVCFAPGRVPAPCLFNNLG